MKPRLMNTNAGSLEQERLIHAKLKDPMIVGFEKYIPATESQAEAILSEFVPNGSLADYLPELNKFWNGTRIAMIVTGIVLAMRYLHSRHIIHGDLNPSNVFIDWSWIVRIGDFENFNFLHSEI
jgi:serine/threonine protein kinase